MGFPLDCAFSNFFLSFHDLKLLANCAAEFKSIYFRRYVDDCYVIFCSREHFLPFQNDLNSQRPNLTFTGELETNSTLPFLDILINRSEGFSDSVYHKSPDPNGQHHAKTIINISLPCTGFHFLQIRTQIQKLCSSAFSDISLWFIFGPCR